jgi:maleylacetate reductase
VTRAFTYTALPMRVRFGAGALAALPDDVAAVGLERVLVLCSPGHEATGRQVADLIGARAAGVLPVARMHVPIQVVDHAAERVAAAGADGCVTVGGGSAIGLGKAVALRHDLPVVAVPTTYAGSEMTPIWGITGVGGFEDGPDRDRSAHHGTTRGRSCGGQGCPARAAGRAGSRARDAGAGQAPAGPRRGRGR